MIYVNGLKYACEACIKGHRSSSCSHTNRPLFEIKKKGRPVTQCEHCRQLRKTKQVHVKCNCEGSTEGPGKAIRGKAKRKMPVSPDFPEGLSGQSLSPSPAPQQKSKASSSSGCDCKSSGHCSCATPIIKKSDRPRLRDPSSDAYSAPATPPPLSPLSSCCSGKSNTSFESRPLVQSGADIDAYPTPLINDFVHATSQAVASTSYDTSDIYYGSSAIPPTMFSWPTGSGVEMCSCGALCACPGCYEHSDPTTLFSSESCPYACTTCSECNGFGFAPSTPSQNPAGSLNSNTALSSNTWPHPTVTPVLPSFASTSTPLSNPPSSPSDRCGGSCKCLAQSLSCECASECCGCCFGCSCSDSESVGTTVAQEEDTRERLGFAVSRERGSCYTEPKPYDRDRPNIPREDGNSTSRKKIRGVEYTHEGRGGVPVYPSQPMSELSTLFPDPSSDSETLTLQDLDSVTEVQNIAEGVIRDGLESGDGGSLANNAFRGGVPGFDDP